MMIYDDDEVIIECQYWGGGKSMNQAILRYSS